MQSASWLQTLTNLLRGMSQSPYLLWVVGVISAFLAIWVWSFLREKDANETN
ncbi:MAG: hypothetical protein AABZ60_11825 [Planctomycetota bacterium]